MRNIAGSILVAMLALTGCQAIRAATTVPTTNLAALTTKTPAGIYKSDPTHTAVLFSVRHFRFANTVGRFRAVDATLQWDPANPEMSKLDVTIATASLDTNAKVIDDPLKAARMFDVTNFPQAHFVSTRVTRDANSATGHVEGDLTIKGVTQPVTLDVTFNGGEIDGLTNRPTLGFAATAKLARSQWGLAEWVPVVGNEVTLQIEIEFNKAPQ